MGRLVMADRDREPRLNAVDSMTGISGRFADSLIVVPGYSWFSQFIVLLARQRLPRNDLPQHLLEAVSEV